MRGGSNVRLTVVAIEKQGQFTQATYIFRCTTSASFGRLLFFTRGQGLGTSLWSYDIAYYLQRVVIEDPRIRDGANGDILLLAVLFVLSFCAAK